MKKTVWRSVAAGAISLIVGAQPAGAQDHGTSTRRTFLLAGDLPSRQSDSVPPGDDASASKSPRPLSLDEAQQVAAQAGSAVARLGQLGVEAAENHRRAVTADYFPQFSTVFWNLHFNEFLGEQISVTRPIFGSPLTVGVPLFGQNQSFIAVNFVQPITPLLKVRQAVKIARADENIARGKAGMPVAESRHALEKSYFDLLIAQRRLALADARVRNARAPRIVASSVPVVANARPDTGVADAEVLELSVSVKILTASLNELLGWPADTRLELETPAPLVERVALMEAVGQALAANPAVIEAEQTVEKARAATKISKLDYVPDIAVIGGWAFQDNFIPLLPDNFGYVGVMGTYNIFNFGKREYSIKERSAQLQMAQTALELTKAKVSAAVKTSYLELERSRTLSELARHTNDGARIRDVRDDYGLDIRAIDERRALEQLELDWRHRQAYEDLKASIGRTAAGF